MFETQNMASPWPLKDEFISSSDRDRDKAPWHRLENLPTPFAEQYARLSQPWLPGFWIRFPYRGLGMWLSALLGTIAAVMILAYSDGVPVDHWDERIQPGHISPNPCIEVKEPARNYPQTKKTSNRPGKVRV